MTLFALAAFAFLSVTRCAEQNRSEQKDKATWDGTNTVTRECTQARQAHRLAHSRTERSIDRLRVALRKARHKSVGKAQQGDKEVRKEERSAAASHHNGVPRRAPSVDPRR